MPRRKKVVQFEMPESVRDACAGLERTAQGLGYLHPVGEHLEVGGMPESISNATRHLCVGNGTAPLMTHR